MKAYKCDRCGDLYEPYGMEVVQKHLSKMGYQTPKIMPVYKIYERPIVDFLDATISVAAKELDLCSHCMASFVLYKDLPQKQEGME